jgi:hypothetical protein
MRVFIMKRTLLLSLAALTISGLVSAQAASIVTNGSFEQGPGGIGSFSGWQTILGDAATFVDSSGQTGTHAGQASDGLWSAYFGSTAASGGSSILQTLTTVVNQTYLLTFDLANDNGGNRPSNAFLATLGGVPVFSTSNLPAQDYAHEQVAFVASGSATTLAFSGYNDGGYLQLDNVVVTATPEPSGFTLLLVGSLAIVFIAGGSRPLREFSKR